MNYKANWTHLWVFPLDSIHIMKDGIHFKQKVPYFGTLTEKSEEGQLGEISYEYIRCWYPPKLEKQFPIDLIEIQRINNLWLTFVAWWHGILNPARPWPTDAEIQNIDPEEAEAFSIRQTMRYITQNHLEKKILEEMEQNTDFQRMMHNPLKRWWFNLKTYRLKRKVEGQK